MKQRSRTALLDHPLFVDELVELLMRYLRQPARRKRPRAGASAKRRATTAS